MHAQSGKAGGRFAIVRAAVFLPVAVFSLAAVLLLAAGPSRAQEPQVPPAESTSPSSAGSTAREALTLVAEAARAWSPDADLVYLENDDDLGVEGRSGRWGYVFISPGNDRARVYSVEEGEIVLAEYLEFDFDAPALPPAWIDSQAALEAAEDKAGAKFRKESGATAGTALLMRGGFDEKHPDVTTWTVVYTASGQPSLFVVVDAINGKVLRTWRG